MNRYEILIKMHSDVIALIGVAMSINFPFKQTAEFSEQPVFERYRRLRQQLGQLLSRQHIEFVEPFSKSAVEQSQCKLARSH